MRIEFTGDLDFEAYRKATDWCDANGYSYGSMQRDDPIGLMKGDFQIAKWRNLSKQDIAGLDGQITGPKRTGPVTVEIFKD